VTRPVPGPGARGNLRLQAWCNGMLASVTSDVHLSAGRHSSSTKTVEDSRTGLRLEEGMPSVRGSNASSNAIGRRRISVYRNEREDPGQTEGPYGPGRLAAWPSLSLNPRVAKECRGCGNCRSRAGFVNRFVNRTRRDSPRRGRRNRSSETGSVLSAEVSTPARDGPRQGRRTSHGS
jgi:hypothetical protein